MKTEALISRLATDIAIRPAQPGRALGLASLAAILLAGAAMLLTIGLRPDFASALGHWRFDMKFIVTLSLAAGASRLLGRAIRPGELESASYWPVAIGPVLLLAALVVELALLPPSTWAATLVGRNWLHCLALVPAFGIGPLAIGIWGLRHGAPTRPALTGFLAGLFAGAVAASFYAANCTDDSPLFVATWYTLGILALGLAGALAGRACLRW